MPDSFTEMRRRNAVRVLDLVRTHGELSRADLARMADLSKATVSSITADLIQGDLLRETGSISTDKGRRPVGLVFNPNGKLAVGVAIDDQNNVTVNITDLNGKLLNAGTYSDSGAADAAQLAKHIKTTFAAAKLESERLCAVGLAVPGPVSLNGGNKFGQLAHALGELLSLTVSLETLVDMAAVAESRAGRLPNDRLVLFVRSSHRLRSTLLYSDNLLSRHHESGGEPGHVIAPWIEDECDCGKVGCANAHIGSQRILVRAEKLGLKVGSVNELIDLCNSGNGIAIQTIGDAGRAAGFALANLINVLAPVTVIVSGRLNNAGDVFFGPLFKTCEEYATEVNYKTSTLMPSTLGADSAAIGAALVALNNTEDFIRFSEEPIK
jgi:predicted NBD/HSP70 family sugar kinase